MAKLSRIAVMLTFAFTVYGKTPLPAGAAPVEIRIVEISEPRLLDPAVDRSATSKRISGSMIERFVGLTSDLKLTSGLAESWERLDDLTWRIKLRDGVRFHNGEPFDSEAVKFSFQWIKDAGVASAYLDSIADVRVVDPATIEFTTHTRTSALPMMLTQLFIFPPEYAASVGREQFGKAPIGTGPMVFDSWMVGRSISVKRNTDYWGGEVGADKITFVWAIEPSARTSLLLAGDVDIAMDIATQDFETVKDGENTVLVTRKTGRTVYLQFNTAADIVSDRRVREAIVRSIDRKTLVEAVLGPIGIANDSMFERSIELPNQGIMPYDLARAKQLLSEVYPNEKPSIDFHFTTGRHPLEPDFAAAMAAMIEETGLEIVQNAREPGAHVQLLFTFNASGMLINSSALLYPHPDNIMRAFFHSKSVVPYCKSKELDEKIDNAITLDGDEAKQAYLEIERMILADLVCAAPLYDMVSAIGTTKNIGGVEPRTDETLDYAPIRKN